MSATTASNGYLIPTGFLSTNGGQVIETNGAAVRLQSIAWFRTKGPVDATLGDFPIKNANDTSTQLATQNTPAMIVARSFNTVRSAWSDVNPQTFQQTIGPAGQRDQKTIFDATTTTGIIASSRMAGGSTRAPIRTARTAPVPPARSPAQYLDRHFRDAVTVIGVGFVQQRGGQTLARVPYSTTHSDDRSAPTPLSLGSKEIPD